LKGIQEEAVSAVLDGDSHLLIAARTAAGKTEACFFPVITLLAENRSPAAGAGIEALYIGPLKALINDQFQRLEPLLAQADIPLRRWHGDVAEGHKQKVLESPAGVLQITPESLEALLLRHPEKNAALFGKLAFVIIDEVHAFMGTDRGSQLICLLERIREGARCNPRRIGLSATLGDYGLAMAWLCQGTERETVLVSERKAGPGGEGGRKISLAVDYRRGPEFYPAIYEQCQGDAGTPFRKCIIFTNSRLEAEETAAALKAIAREQGEGDHYHVHHGSIAASLRQETEKQLRETEGASAIMATATLELGIDIGALDRIIQIGAPVGVSAFVQRLGRSGRRSGKSQMYFCSRQYHENPGSPPDRIPWTLVKTIAVIQLYLEEQWTEGAERKPLPYSLLCHQTLSVLASQGEHDAGGLSRQILGLPPFREVDAEDYAELLGALARRGCVETMDNGKLILGLEGERIISHYSFYAVFPDDEEFRVTFNGKELGKVNFIPPEGSGLALGGRTWKVKAVNLRSREIFVGPGAEGGARIWRGGGGSLHSRVVSRMRQVLMEDKIYPYLSASASAALARSREAAGELSLGKSLFIPWTEGGAGQAGQNEGNAESYSFFFIPWLGSRGMRTLHLLIQKKENQGPLKIISLEQENHYCFRIVSGLDTEQFGRELVSLIAGLPDLETLPSADRIPYTDKFDYLLPSRLLVKQYAANMLDREELLLLKQKIEAVPKTLKE
jgi:ATP-dependent Lhr-like helicase